MTSRSQRKRQAEHQAARWNARFPGAQRVGLLDPALALDTNGAPVEYWTCAAAYVHQGHAVVFVEQLLRLRLDQVRAVERPLPGMPEYQLAPECPTLLEHLYQVSLDVQASNHAGTTPSPSEYSQRLNQMADQVGPLLDDALAWVRLAALALEGALRCGASPVEITTALLAPYRPSDIPQSLQLARRRPRRRPLGEQGQGGQGHG